MNAQRKDKKVRFFNLIGPISMKADVEKYYDNNTRRFLKYGPHYGTYGIHREVWGDGVKTPQEAFNFTNSLILRYIKKNKSEFIIDLGCGVGGSLFYLAQAYSKAQFYGITISSEQVNLSKDICKNLDLRSSCTISKGNFQNLPKEIPPMDLAFSIEAFAHATDNDRFFSEISAKTRSNGFLVICDDFLSEMASDLPINSKEHGLISLFRKGWILGSLVTTKRAQDIASQHGYRMIENINFTPSLRLRKKRDIFIGLIAPFFKYLVGFSTYIRAYVGGDALQRCLLKGLVEYRFLVFQKVDGSSPGI